MLDILLTDSYKTVCEYSKSKKELNNKYFRIYFLFPKMLLAFPYSSVWNMTPVISVVSVCFSDVCGSHIYCSSMKYRNRCSPMCLVSTNPVQTIFSSFILKLDYSAFLKCDMLFCHTQYIRTGHQIKYMLWM
jgi:hypothetical protein